MNKGLLYVSALVNIQHLNMSETLTFLGYWDEARILDIESYNRYRKYKEAAHMACSINPISQPSLDFSPIWIPIISNEVTNSQKKSI
jgi:hypothetical protein